MKFFAGVIALGLRFVPAYGNLAYIHVLRSENEKAVSYLRRILEVNPNNARAKSMLEQNRSLSHLKLNCQKIPDYDNHEQTPIHQNHFRRCAGRAVFYPRLGVGP
jgi:hypothetical protein